MMKTVVSFLILMGSSFAMAEALPSLQSIRDNNKGVDQLKASQIQMSQELFIQALSQNPRSPEIQLNLGVTFSQQQQQEKAQAAYETALKMAKDDKSKFAALFNLGELAQKAKKKEEAINYYQQALKYDPKSLETKVNIELLTKDGDGKGESENQDKDQNKDDKKDQSGDGQDQKEQEPKDEDGDKENQEKKISKGKPQPKQFKSQELSQSDVNKILDELKQQEQKIRAEFNRREAKEKPRDKDW